MSAQLTGAPKTTVSVSDETNLLVSALGGIICVQGETMRGEPGKGVFIGNSLQFKRKLGGLHPTSPFPAYCLRLLDAGAKLYVARAAHYTDVDDRTTAQGTKATGTIGAASFSSVYAGAGYNGTSVTVQDAASYTANLFDIVVKLAGQDQVQTITDVKATNTAGELVALNRRLAGSEVKLVSGTLTKGTVLLSGGAEDITAITATDYNGSALGSTGWYAFGTITDAFRIANIHKPVPEIDAALAQYTIKRGDMRFHLGFPTGANALGLEDYRMGTGSYTHSPINTWVGSAYAGATLGNDGVNLDQELLIPGIVEALASIARKDRGAPGPWFSASIFEYARVQSYTNGVPYNLASPDNADDFDRIYPRGINAVVKDPTDGVMITGNRSLLLDSSKILSKENVADLLIYMVRAFKPIFRRESFQPDDPQMWRAIHRAALPIIEQLERGRAIQKGAGVNHFWIGDQDADDVSKAVYNTQAELQNGKYRARFVFKPIAATEFLSLDLVAADANSLAYAVTQSPTF